MFNNKNHIKKISLIFSLSLLLSIPVCAQEGFGKANPNKDAVADLASVNKGMLLPRLALTATNAAAPLSAMVAGMMVYNTASTAAGANQVTPGIYFNDGIKWVKFYDQPVLPWNNASNQALATNEIQDIYQTGNVAIGTGGASVLTHKLAVTAPSGADPIRTTGLQLSPNSNAEKILVINPASGVLNWINFSAIKMASYRSTTSQVLTNGSMALTSVSSGIKAPLIFTNTDAQLAQNFATIDATTGVFTITDGGLFDIYLTANLSVPANSSFTADPSQLAVTGAMAVNLNIEKLVGSTWTPIANTRTALDVRSGELGQPGVMSLTPVNVSVALSTGDQLRFVAQRGYGMYLSSGTMSFLADASKGAPISKTLRMIRLQ